VANLAPVKKKTAVHSGDLKRPGLGSASSGNTA
jgi:hypothetical protein